MLHIKNKNDNTHKKAFAVEISTCLMLLVIFSSGIAQASDITAEMVIKLTNNARKSVGVAQLKKNELLMKAAQEKAQDMLDKDYFAHISPQGKTPWDWISDAGYDYKYAGENLAISFTDAEGQQEAWMNSELHRKNILNPDYEEIGVAVKSGKVDGKKTIVTVQEFGAMMPKIIANEPTAKTTSEYAKIEGQTIEKVEVNASSAGIRIQNSFLKNDINPIDLGEFFEKNPAMTWGWIGIFAVAITVLVVDFLALFHRKHPQMLIFHRARNRKM